MSSYFSRIPQAAGSFLQIKGILTFNRYNNFLPFFHLIHED